MNKQTLALLVILGSATASTIPQAWAAEPAASARPASDKPVPIVVDTAAAWTHPPTGIIVPPAIGAFTRTSVSQSDHGLADVVIGYDDNTTGTALTLYVFRAGWPQAPLWADRLSHAMAVTVQRTGGNLTGAPVFTPFAPTGHASMSALRVVQGASGGRVLATGAVVIPAGQWLVTMRMSSPKFNAAMLDRKLAEVAAALRVPAPAKPLPAAVPIAGCADTMSLPTAPVAPPWDRHAILTGTILSATRDQAETPEGKKPLGPNPRTTRLCRDPASTMERGIYRLPEDGQRYVLGLGDAGVTLEVGPSALAPAFKQPAMFDVILSVFDKTFVFPPFASLPPPDQAMAALGKSRPEAEVGDDKQVTIFQ